MKIAVLPGDDIGPEITDATLRVLEKLNDSHGLKLAFEMHDVGMAAHGKTGSTLPDAAMEAARTADGVILGPCGLNVYPPPEDGGIKVPGTIRKTLKLHANIRPAKARPGLPRALPGLDCIIARENTEGFYADRNLFSGYGEFMPVEGVAMSMRLITDRASRLIARTAFDLAEMRRRHISMIGKRHVLEVTDGVFMDAVRDVGKDYPNVELREIDIDAMAAEIYTNPERFDVILTTNMYGDILSNLAAALSGGLGMAAALNAGLDHAAANAGHGSAPDIAGNGIANPTGLMRSAAMLLTWLGQKHASNSLSDAGARFEAAIDACLEDPATRTGDLGGSASTRDVADAILNHL